MVSHNPDLNARHSHVREEQGEETGVGLQLQPAVSEVVQILLLTRHLVPSLGQSHHHQADLDLTKHTGVMEPDNLQERMISVHLYISTPSFYQASDPLFRTEPTTTMRQRNLDFIHRTNR